MPMKPKRVSLLVVPITLLAAAGWAESTGALASASQAHATQAKAHPVPIQGTWKTRISLDAAPPGVPTQFRALDTFTSRGGLLVSSSAPNPSTRNLAHGVWARTGRRDFTSSFVWFRFDGSGNYIGTQRVDRTMKLSRSGRRFRAADVITILSPSGDVLATTHGTEAGRRLPRH